MKLKIDMEIEYKGKIIKPNEPFEVDNKLDKECFLALGAEEAE